MTAHSSATKECANEAALHPPYTTERATVTVLLDGSIKIEVGGSVPRPHARGMAQGGGRILQIGDRASAIKRLERRVINAAMRLADYGRGFVFKDSGKVAHVGLAMKLEKACGNLRDAIRANSHTNDNDNRRGK